MRVKKGGFKGEMARKAWSPKVCGATKALPGDDEGKAQFSLLASLVWEQWLDV